MVAEPYYQILLNFTPYIQLMAAVDFGLLLLESRSLTVKFQKRVLGLQKEHYKPILKEAGLLTMQCQERRFNQTDEGRLILGLAERIRKRKEVFGSDTELEKQSAFMPALGLTSGLFCLLYLIIVPFILSDHSEATLYWLEYSAEAVLIGQIVVILTYMLLPQYRGYLTSLAICFSWVIIGLLLSLILYLFDCNLSFGGFAPYEFLILLIPSMPLAFLFMRLVCMVFDRVRRIRKMNEDIVELRKSLQSYHSNV